MSWITYKIGFLRILIDRRSLSFGNVYKGNGDQSDKQFLYIQNIDRIIILLYRRLLDFFITSVLLDHIFFIFRPTQLFKRFCDRTVSEIYLQKISRLSTSPFPFKVHTSVIFGAILVYKRSATHSKKLVIF